ncbi:hypothetical protein ACFQY9_25495, partial [Microvirga aerilata]|uniref:hypothetical protein n=1 Tax=Microvirga aerilata TaxID=670292 RepID=UPI00362541E3
ALVAIFAGWFLLMAAGAPLLIGQQLRAILQDRDDRASDELSVFEEVTVDRPEPLASFPAPEEASAPDGEEAFGGFRRRRPSIACATGSPMTSTTGSW